MENPLDLAIRRVLHGRLFVHKKEHPPSLPFKSAISRPRHQNPGVGMQLQHRARRQWQMHRANSARPHLGEQLLGQSLLERARHRFRL